MATYAIGDIQGCHTTLLRLVERLRFDPARDRLWLVGDLVNRGPGSLEVLRWAKAQGTSVVVVLGNHDLYLLARVFAAAKKKTRDTLENVMTAPDRDELVAWLRTRPLIHHEGAHVLVHAGLHPSWSVAEAESFAREGETMLRGEGAAEFFGSAHYTRPPVWTPSLQGLARIGGIVATLTRLRTCTTMGAPAYEFAGPPRSAPPGFLPWFTTPGRKSRDATVIFGHWAALGLHIEPGIVGLDSGCVYGNRLTAWRLEDEEVIQERCADS
jgi:bis(5'-nucleosyl)-tetraphosphatase (symmetrical)